MIVKLSEMLLKFVLKNIRIEKEMIDIYRYGIELLVSTLINLALITIIGILINDIACSLVFLLGFIPIRSFCGGYHAKSYLKCNIVFSLSFVICCLCSNLMIFAFTKNYLLIIEIALIALSFPSILIFAPVKNANKIVSSNEAKKYKKISIIIFICISGIGLITTYFGIKYDILLIVTLLLVSIMILIEIFEQRRGL